MFRLLRYFSIASLLAFVVVTILLGLLYRQTAERDVIEIEESKNVALSRAFANSLWEEFVVYIHQTEGLGVEELRTYPRISKLHESVVEQMQGLSVVKVKVYNLDGMTVFSTQSDQIGESAFSNAGFTSAKNGQIASELTHRDTFNTFDGEIEDQDVVGAYIPIQRGAIPGKIEGVLEVYTDVTPMLQQISYTQRTITLGVALILSALYLVLYLIVRHADRIIKQQRIERSETEQELRRQQQALATLKERERLARELHDTIGQVLGYVKMQSHAAREQLSQGKYAQTDSLLKRLNDAVQHAHLDVRESILNLQSGASQEPSFMVMLEEYLSQFSHLTNIEVELVAPDDLKNIYIEAATKAQLIRIVQEALTNVRKHAQAKQVTITVNTSGHEVQISIQDDGLGFEPDHARPFNGYHVGLGIMRDRALDIGGRIQIDSIVGRGATVTATVPLMQLKGATV